MLAQLLQNAVPIGLDNATPLGGVADRLIASNGDVRVLRPFVGNDGRSYIDHNGPDGKPSVMVTNTPATLRKDDWIQLDQAILRVQKNRLRVFNDLRRRGLSYTIGAGMGKTTLEHQTQSDIGPAQVSMDGNRRGESDRPLFELEGIPLPLIHKDFEFPLREILASRQNGHQSLDSSNAELAARRIAETVEALTIGNYGSFQYAGRSLYGYTTFPDRIAYTLTPPDSAGWTPAVTVHEVLGMRQASMDAFYYGPWMLYHSTDWDEYMDDDYSAAKGDNTLRERLMKIRGIEAVESVDNLSGWQMILVQMTSDVAQAVVGMEMMTLQWESNGGMMLHFKIMCMLLPRLRSDYNGNTGIVHANE